MLIIIRLKKLSKLLYKVYKISICIESGRVRKTQNYKQFELRDPMT
jgi:hypothetical protein